MFHKPNKIALVKVANKINFTISYSQFSFITLLDILITFDAVDHFLFLGAHSFLVYLNKSDFSATFLVVTSQSTLLDPSLLSTARYWLSSVLYLLSLTVGSLLITQLYICSVNLNIYLHLILSYIGLPNRHLCLDT